MLTTILSLHVIYHVMLIKEGKTLDGQKHMIKSALLLFCFVLTVLARLISLFFV